LQGAKRRRAGLGERTAPRHDLAGESPRPLPAPDTDDTDGPIAAVEAMIAELGRLWQRTGDRAVLGAYQEALNSRQVWLGG
jgi:hypothetical protein